VIFQDVVPFAASPDLVVAGAVRKWKSALAISKARTYRAVFCTAWQEMAAQSHGLQQYNVLSIYSHPTCFFAFIP